MKTGVVMPVGLDRNENVMRVMESLAAQSLALENVVCMLDGFSESETMELKVDLGRSRWPFTVHLRPTPKHRPGLEQPRNVGVRVLKAVQPDASHVWFVDSDVIVSEDAHRAFSDADFIAGPAVQVAPYDWLPPGQRYPDPSLCNDPRWPSFNAHDPDEIVRNDLSAGLACFSGNLVWPIAEFVKVGGFWSEIHHGRCEDGELGLRAVALGVPIQFVRAARGWHLWHPVNIELARERNARDVPMLNERHPWVQQEGLEMVPEDGRRFNVRCDVCGQSINTLDWWHHAETCGRTDA